MSGQRIAISVATVGIAILVASPAYGTIVTVEPGGATVDAGASTSAIITLDSSGGSCLTADAGDPGVTIDFMPQCDVEAGELEIQMTVVVEAGVASGSYTVRIQEFDAALENLIDTTTFALEVRGSAPPTTVVTSTTAGATTTTPPTTAASTTSTATTTTPPTTAASTTTTAATISPPTTAAPTAASSTSTSAVSSSSQPLSRGGSSSVPWWPIVLGSVVLAAAAAGIARFLAGRDAGVASFRGITAPASLDLVARLVGDAGAGRAGGIVNAVMGAGRAQLNVDVRPIERPEDDLVVTFYSGRRARKGFDLVAKGEPIASTGRRAVAVVVAGEEPVTLTVEPETLSRMLSFLPDDLSRAGSPELAATIRRWLG